MVPDGEPKETTGSSYCDSYLSLVQDSKRALAEIESRLDVLLGTEAPHEISKPEADAYQNPYDRVRNELSKMLICLNRINERLGKF